MNSLGPVAAVTTFLTIWIGHVTVRKLEARTANIRVPMVVAIVLGLVVEYGALIINYRPTSMAMGILGITLLWDAFELHRQENRVKHGHAPANPNNLRHTRILAEYASATSFDLLKRDPIGRSVRSEEPSKQVLH